MGGHIVEFVKYLGSNYEVVILRYKYLLNRKFTDKEITTLFTESHEQDSVHFEWIRYNMLPRVLGVFLAYTKLLPEPTGPRRFW